MAMTPEQKKQFSKKLFRLIGIVVAQLCIFIFACAWLGEQITRDLLSHSVKEATRHRLWKPRRLIEVSAGVALVGGSFWFNEEHLWLSLIVLFVFGVLQLLVTGWTTLLTPTTVSCQTGLQGTEQNLVSPAFLQSLGTDLSTFASNIVRDDAFPLLDVGGSVSGVSAAGITFGMPSIINFNEAKYNLTTCGVLPVIQSFAGSMAQPYNGRNGTRLQFSGGATIVNNNISTAPSGPMDNWFGIQTNYTVDQQGITAVITCQAADNNTLNLNLNLSNLNTTVTMYAPGSSSASTLVLWNSTAQCNAKYVTSTNASDQADSSGTGFLPTVLCPAHINGSDAYSKFVIATQGFDKYDFLPSTVCERVNYINGGIIDASQILSQQSFSSNDTGLLFYLASVANYHARNAQGLANNFIGDTLYAVYSGQYGAPIGGNESRVYMELEDYWRGVIEFSATFLRAGYSADGAFVGGVIPSNMTVSYNGTMSILTVGWSNRGAIYIFSVLPLGIVTFLTMIAAAYSVYKSWKYPGEQTSFDISDMLHLIMASAHGSTGDDLGSKLSGFDEDGLKKNEQLRVKLMESNTDHKKSLTRMFGCQFPYIILCKTVFTLTQLKLHWFFSRKAVEELKIYLVLAQMA
ncbi:hypothetical protein BU15DRAFT_64858 [Melanogaster broomeanus]|nr:hypothetical protein BU15DRAFT_64858 [Melanogaster broomeanus]